MLPSTPDGKPDFEYMEAYGREIIRERLNRYRIYRAADDTFPDSDFLSVVT